MKGVSGITIAIVVAGVAAAVLLGIAVGVDAGGVVIFGILFGLGILAIAVARKATTGEVEPARCSECEGLVSPSAPYCKHCGTRTS